MNLRLLILIILLCSTEFLFAGKGEEQKMLEAQAALEQENYAKASELYKSIYDSNFYSRALFNNAAYAFHKSGKNGEAILFLERGLKYFPNDMEMRGLLQELKELSGNDIFEVEAFIGIRYWNKLAQFLRPLSWFIIELLFLLLFGFLMYSWRFGDSAEMRLASFKYSMVIFVFFLLSVFLGHSSEAHYNNNSRAVIMKPTDMNKAADKRSGSIRVLAAGINIEIIDSLQGWVKIELRNHEQGWVEPTVYEPI